jgi:hypothetical protein
MNTLIKMKTALQYTYTILALCFLSLTVSQTVNSQSPINESYDKFKGIKTYGTNEFKVPAKSGEPRLIPDVSIRAVAQFDEQGNERFAILITCFSGYQPVINPQVIMLIDGKRELIGTINANSSSSKIYSIIDFPLFVPLTLIKQIANAKTVEAQMGGVEFSLNEAVLNAFREFVRKVEPLSSTAKTIIPHVTETVSNIKDTIHINRLTGLWELTIDSEVEEMKYSYFIIKLDKDKLQGIFIVPLLYNAAIFHSIQEKDGIFYLELPTETGGNMSFSAVEQNNILTGKITITEANSQPAIFSWKASRIMQPVLITTQKPPLTQQSNPPLQPKNAPDKVLPKTNKKP